MPAQCDRAPAHIESPAQSPTDPVTPGDDGVYFAIAEIRPEGLSMSLGTYLDVPAALAGIRRHARVNRRSTPNPTLRVYASDDPTDVLALVEVWRNADDPSSVASCYRVFEATTEASGD